MKTKQVIVMRKDLNMRKGKMIAQGAHASLKAVLDSFRSYSTSDGTLIYEAEFGTGEDCVMHNWLTGNFAKICVSVDSEEELMNIYNKAKAINDFIPLSLIRDAGLTEFGGVPTYTCICIGPYISEEIDKITGHLKLL